MLPGLYERNEPTRLEIFQKKLHENAHFIRCLRVIQLIFLFGFCKSETEEAATECALERNLFLKIFRKIQR